MIVPIRKGWHPPENDKSGCELVSIQYIQLNLCFSNLAHLVTQWHSNLWAYELLSIRD